MELTCIRVVSYGPVPLVTCKMCVLFTEHAKHVLFSTGEHGIARQGTAKFAETHQQCDQVRRPSCCCYQLICVSTCIAVDQFFIFKG